MLIFALFSCNTIQSNKSSNDNLEDSLNLVRYADNLDIYRYKSGYKLIINTNSDVKTFYLFNDTVNIPDDIVNEEIIIDELDFKDGLIVIQKGKKVFLKVVFE